MVLVFVLHFLVIFLNLFCYFIFFQFGFWSCAFFLFAFFFGWVSLWLVAFHGNFISFIFREINVNRSFWFQLFFIFHCPLKKTRSICFLFFSKKERKNWFENDWDLWIIRNFKIQYIVFMLLRTQISCLEKKRNFLPRLNVFCLFLKNFLFQFFKHSFFIIIFHSNDELFKAKFNWKIEKWIWIEAFVMSLFVWKIKN